MFVTIVGTVLLASTLSPLLAWLLRVKAGDGATVLLVGAHPLAVSFAKSLGAHGVPTRVIDNNDTRVAVASQAGLDAVTGDATDARWMDDVGTPHGTGWVIAWTGNHDVDQLVARWSDERLGHRHVGVWSSKPARGALERADISQGEPIADMLQRLDEGAAQVVRSDDPATLHRLLGWIQNNRFFLYLPGGVIPPPPPRAHRGGQEF